MGYHDDRVAELQRQVAELKEAIQQAQMAAMQRQLEHIQGQLTAARDEITAARQEYAAQKTRAGALEAEKEARLKSAADYMKPAVKIVVSPLVLPMEANITAVTLRSRRDLLEVEKTSEEAEDAQKEAMPDDTITYAGRHNSPESIILFVDASDDFKDGPLVLKAVALPFRCKKRKGPPDPENEDFARVLKFMFHKRIDPP